MVLLVPLVLEVHRWYPIPLWHYCLVQLLILSHFFDTMYNKHINDHKQLKKENIAQFGLVIITEPVQFSKFGIYLWLGRPLASTKMSRCARHSSSSEKKNFLHRDHFHYQSSQYNNKYPVWKVAKLIYTESRQFAESVWETEKQKRMSQIITSWGLHDIL